MRALVSLTLSRFALTATGLLAAALAAVFAIAAVPRDARAEDAKLTVIVFPGMQNLPMFAAQAKGYPLQPSHRGIPAKASFARDPPQ